MVTRWTTCKRSVSAMTTKWTERDVLGLGKTASLKAVSFQGVAKGIVDDLLMKLLSFCGVEKAW